MFIYILFFIIILLPLLVQYRNKCKALKISFILLFFPLAFQYEVCNDWIVNLERWMVANVSGSYSILNIRDSEPLYLFILHIFKPIGFFGFLIISAALQLYVFYKLIKIYVNPKYYWVSLFIFIIYVNNFALYYINSNRQTYSMLLTIFAVLLILEFRKSSVSYNRIKFALFVLLIYIAHFIHTAAYSAIGLIIIYFVVTRKSLFSIKWFIIACNILFFLRFFIDISQYQYIYQNLWIDNVSSAAESFGNYFNDLEEYGKGRVFSIWQQTPNLIAMNLMLIGYNKVSVQGRFFILCSVFSILLNGFLVATLQRVMQYYAVYTWIAIPMVLPYINKICNEHGFRKARNVLFAYLIAYALFQFHQNVNPNSLYYNKWYNYTSFFDATEWL